MKELENNNNRNLLNDVIDKDLYIQQQQDFQNLIIYGHNPNYFIVEDYEATWGKSTLSLNTLPLYKQNNPNKRVLYVSERADQCTENAETVNKLFGKEVAKAIVSGVSKENREKYLQEYDIIFITQERYRRLSRPYNKEEKKLYTDNRHLLIVDEKPEMYKEITFSLSKNAVLENEIGHLAKWNNEILELYKKIVETLVVSLKHTDKSRIKNISFTVVSYTTDVKEIDTLIQQFEDLMYKTVENESVFYKNYDEKNYQTILEKVEDLREFYNGQSVMYYSKADNEIIMSVPNYSLEMWLLQDNNIVLDATASIDMSYTLNIGLFHIAYEKKVFNHYRWTIEWANINSTTSATVGEHKKYTNFKEVINQIIEEQLGKNNTLVLATMYDDVIPISKGSKEVEKRNKFKGIVTHQGIINSSNEHKEIANFINANLCYADDKSYVLKYLFYSKEKLECWTSGGGKFKNKELENFKMYEVARLHYQAMKRINRNMDLDSRLIFLCHRAEIRDIVFNMFNGINIIHSSEIEDMFEKVKENNIQQFISMCKYIINNKELPDVMLDVLKDSKDKETALRGRIRKGIFAKCLGITSNSFGNNILHNKTSEDMQLFREEFGNNIDENKNYLIFKGFLK